MPAGLVVELDQAVAAEYNNNIYWSRADAIAVAVRRFLDQGGRQLTPFGQKTGMSSEDESPTVSATPAHGRGSRDG